MTTKEELIGSIITNTKRSGKSRNKSIFEIATDMLALKKMVGDLDKIAEIAGISTNMVNKFLSVFKLEGTLMELVKQRTIDSVETVYSLAKFPHSVQLEISSYILSGKLNSQDVRALSPYIRQNPNIMVSESIEKLISSKDIKISVIKFKVDQNLDKERFKQSVLSLMGNDGSDLVSLEFNGTGLLKVKKSGEKKLRQQAKTLRVTLAEFINRLLSE